MTEAEQVDLLQNKTHLCRFSKGEVREILAFMRENGLLKVSGAVAIADDPEHSFGVKA